MKFEIIEGHKCNNKEPLVIRKGTRVKVGKRSGDEDGWANWIYCYSLDRNSEGWTPEQIVQVEGEDGIVLEDYSAEELDVEKGEIVEGNKELNGWIWCRRVKGAEEGWLPKEKMKYELINGYNADIHIQLETLESIVMSSKVVGTAIERGKLLNLDNYYIGAGCIVQTVWNYLSNNPLEYGIKDIDFVYFDDKSLDFEAENAVVSQVKELYADLNIEVDVKNQARVHLWYKSHFGNEIEPYISLEAAINTWPTTATSIGVRKEKNGEFKVYAPFGLNDLFGKIVRANKAQITKQVYESKVSRWLSKWPDLKVIPWEK